MSIGSSTIRTPDSRLLPCRSVGRITRSTAPGRRRKNSGLRTASASPTRTVRLRSASSSCGGSRPRFVCVLARPLSWRSARPTLCSCWPLRTRTMRDSKLRSRSSALRGGSRSSLWCLIGQRERKPISTRCLGPHELRILPALHARLLDLIRRKALLSDRRSAIEVPLASGLLSCRGCALGISNLRAAFGTTNALPQTVA